MVLFEIGLAWALGAFDKPKGPDKEDAEAERRKREEELAKRKGRGSSIVTGGAGLTEPATLGKSSLLGAA